MFVKAIQEVANFTRPLHFVTRKFDSTSGVAGTGTLFFVNELGVAVTCKHITNFIGQIASINNTYDSFNVEKAKIPKTKQYDRHLKELKTKFKYDDDATIQALHTLMNVTTERSFNMRWVNHPTYDLAILFIDDFKNPLYKSHAFFAKDTSRLQQGKFLCRLGYPFPEFTNFQYNADLDKLEWTTTGMIQSPTFPIEGMLTRHVMVGTKMVGVELSTPGLRGQSGGPLFDTDGVIYGMQFSTNHFHLGFDMKGKEIISDGKKIKVTNQPFLHVGRCIHADVIKEFLHDNGVKFYEK